MPDHPSPGTCLEEAPSSVRTITGVTTSVTAFIGRTRSGPTDRAVRCRGMADFLRTFGGAHPENRLADCVGLFFANGGSECYVVRTGCGRTGRPGFRDVAGSPSARTGLHALDAAGYFGLMVVPGDDGMDEETSLRVLACASAYCRDRRALLLMDAPASWTDPATGRPAVDRAMADALRRQVVPESAAVFLPGIRYGKGRGRAVMGPAGAVAGVIARNDAVQGAWKSPAGTGAVLKNVTGLQPDLTQPEMARLHPLGINCLKTTPCGIVLRGARTLAGTDNGAVSEWKYIAVRRLALYIEESLARGTAWAAFEPDDEPLWNAIRVSASAFLHALFVQGAFAGTTPEDAFFVRCGHDTITAEEQAKGIVNILVGFAPLKPAEFIILRIRQAAGGT